MQVIFQDLYEQNISNNPSVGDILKLDSLGKVWSILLYIKLKAIMPL